MTEPECACGSVRWVWIAEAVRVAGGGDADVGRCKVCRVWIVVIRDRALVG